MKNLTKIPQFSPRNTLKEISYDRANKEYMTNSSISVVDFDLVAKNYERRWKLVGNCPSSADALYFDDNHQILIEFKNGEVNSNQIKSIKKKIRDSILMFCDITNTNMNYTRKYLSFILVYNEVKRPKDLIKSHFLQKGNENFIRFGLSVFKGSHFKDIATLSGSEFQQFLRTLKSQTHVKK